jgi:broad specificity phosphatase PhoE
VSRGSVVALAGQRVDAAGRPKPRFPPERVPLVAARIRDALGELGATALVCSAASGADLLALEQAGALGLQRHVVLPFDASRFRETSVADRPGDWLHLFDRTMTELDSTGDVETMAHADSNGDSNADGYAAANVRILDVAQALAAARSAELVAVVVWDRAAAEWYAVTARFMEEARRRGLRVVEIPTAGNPAA